MIVKVFMLVAVMYYFINNGDPKKAAIFWTALSAIAALIFEGLSLEAVLWVGLAFVVSYTVFWVISYSEGSAWHWLSYLGGMAALFLFA